MDGFLRPSFAAAPERSAPLVGILYAEDFDEPPLSSQAAAELAMQGLSAESAPTPRELDHACSAAVEQAREQWEREAGQQRQRSLATIAQALAAAREDAAREASLIAEGLVTTVLAMLAGALPGLCRSHGPSEVRTLVQYLLPHLRSEPRITIRVHPTVVPVLEHDLSTSELELSGTIAVVGASLEPGDVRVTWENGSCKRDTREILTAMQDALAQLGLHRPIELTPERRMERAE